MILNLFFLAKISNEIFSSLLPKGIHLIYPVNDIGNEDRTKFLYTYSTTSVGGGSSHNNMPPFLTANCWKRTG